MFSFCSKVLSLDLSQLGPHSEPESKPNIGVISNSASAITSASVGTLCVTQLHVPNPRIRLQVKQPNYRMMFA